MNSITPDQMLFILTSLLSIICILALMTQFDWFKKKPIKVTVQDTDFVRWLAFELMFKSISEEDAEQLIREYQEEVEEFPEWMCPSGKHDSE